MGLFDLEPHIFRVDKRGRAYVDDTLIRVHPRIEALRGPRTDEDPKDLREVLQALQPLLLLKLQLSPILVIAGKEELLAVWNVHLFDDAFVLRPPILFYQEVPEEDADNSELITAMIHSQAYFVPLLHALNSKRTQVLATHLAGRTQKIVLAFEGWQLPLTEILQKHLAAFLHIGRSGVSMTKQRISSTAKPTTGGTRNPSKHRTKDGRSKQDRPDANHVKPGSTTKSTPTPGTPVVGPDRPPAESTRPPAPPAGPQVPVTSDADAGGRLDHAPGVPAPDVPLHDPPSMTPEQSTPSEPEPTTPLVRPEGMLFALPPPDAKARRSRQGQASQMMPKTGGSGTSSSDTLKKAS